MQIRIATTDDVADTYKLYDDARSDLRGRNIFQWPDNYPSGQTVQTDIDRRELYLITVNDQIAGAVCLNQRQDEQYKDVNWLLDGSKVMVVHRLVVAPQLQGKGLARKLMTFAEQLATAEEYTCIRLDAYTGHERTRLFYEQRGYQVRGEVFFPQREMPFWCFEREV